MPPPPPNEDATTGLQPRQRVCPPFSWPPFEAAYYFFSEFTVRASTPLLQLLVLVSRASWQLAEAQPAVHTAAPLPPPARALQGCDDWSSLVHRKALAVSLSTVGC